MKPLFAFLLALLVHPLSAAQFGIVHGEQSVTISGVTPGGAVAIYVLSRAPRDFESRVQREAWIVRDNDGDGVIHHDVGGPLPVKTISFAADLTTGAFTMATRQGHAPGLLPIGDRLRYHLAAGRTTVDPTREFYDLVVVRPATGMWQDVVGDGGLRDLDRTTNGIALAALITLRAIGDSPAAPAAFQRGDIVLIIDSRRMDAVAEKIR
jgi:hypothetical protein